MLFGQDMCREREQTRRFHPGRVLTFGPIGGHARYDRPVVLVLLEATSTAVAAVAPLLFFLLTNVRVNPVEPFEALKQG